MSRCAYQHHKIVKHSKQWVGTRKSWFFVQFELFWALLGGGGGGCKCEKSWKNRVLESEIIFRTKNHVDIGSRWLVRVPGVSTASDGLVSLRNLQNHHFLGKKYRFQVRDLDHLRFQNHENDRSRSSEGVGWTAAACYGPQITLGDGRNGQESIWDNPEVPTCPYLKTWLFFPLIEHDPSKSLPRWRHALIWAVDERHLCDFELTL